MFPKRLGSGGRTTVMEPSSPKVSCIGRVRSKRCLSRRRAAQSAKPVMKLVNQTEKSQKTGIKRRRTCNKSLMKGRISTINL
ncbi:hypothetical protein Hanom_Chr15g01384741 [Helianthus anomalus]